MVGYSLGCLTVVVMNRCDDLPYVQTDSRQPGESPGGSAGKPDQRMLIHPQALLDVALGQGAVREVQAPSVSSETFGCH
jgi:hypothetical protein